MKSTELIYIKGDENVAIDAQWIPVISEGVSWVTSKLGPSKKELNIKISELEQQVQLLMAGNVALTNNLNLIIQAILNQLQASNSFIINADSISLVGSNSGVINTEKSYIAAEKIYNDIVQSEKKEGKDSVSKIFDGVDEEIAHTRIAKPSNRQ